MDNNKTVNILPYITIHTKSQTKTNTRHTKMYKNSGAKKNPKRSVDYLTKLFNE